MTRRAKSIGRMIRDAFKRQQRTEQTRRKADRSADRRQRVMAMSRRRHEERLNRWRQAFPHWLPLPWSTAGRLAALMVEWFTTMFGTQHQAHVAQRRRITGKRFSFFEPLEQRQLLAANIWTDQPDYAPGSTAHIGGSGFAVGESVQLQVLHTDDTPNTGGGHDPWIVSDGASGDLDGLLDGNIQTSWYVNPDDSGGSSFLLTAFGLSSGEAASATFTDTDPPVITGITTDTGSSSSDGITNDNTLFINGTAPAGSNVWLYLGGSGFDGVVANSSGIWSYDYTATGLGDGTYTFEAEVVDNFGDLNPLSDKSDPFDVTVDTAAPSAPSITAIADDVRPDADVVWNG